MSASANDFESRLEQGQMGESLIARWLQRRGYSVLPAYEKEVGEYKGPRIFSAKRSLVAPDIFAFRFQNEQKRVFWVEAKSKAAFTWHRLSKTYQDGIDRRHWRDYHELRNQMPWDLWILFLHAPGGVTKDNPPDKVPPVGLFGGEVLHLARCIDHESERWGRSGMVYWQCKDLMRNGKPIATYEEVCDEWGNT